MALELIETIEVGAGGASSIEFTSIPQDGVDLLLVASIRSNLSGTADNFRFKINAGNVTNVELQGNGSGVGSTGSLTNNVGVFNGNTSTSNTFGNGSVYISNYTSATAHSLSADTVNENNATQSYAGISAGISSSTAAVTSLTIYGYGSTLLQYSTASLYKIS